MPARQIGKPKTSDSNADKLFDTISDRFKHTTNLPIYSLPQNHSKTRRREGAKPRNFRAISIEKNST
jgi:hypothetical protein